MNDMKNAGTASTAPTEPKVTEKVKALLDKMSLEEKIGQKRGYAF